MYIILPPYCSTKIPGQLINHAIENQLSIESFAKKAAGEFARHVDTTMPQLIEQGSNLEDLRVRYVYDSEPTGIGWAYTIEEKGVEIFLSLFRIKNIE